ncbi:MAG: hypothetical protein ACRERE_37425 [Candidatus Entotheonellia bacterium]
MPSLFIAAHREQFQAHHLLTAVALNVVRLGAWWQGVRRAITRRSPFAALRVVAA